MRDLSGQVAIVTGASSGVGWLAALRLAEAGCKLVLAARRPGPLTDLARRIERGGGEAMAVPTDVTDEDAVQALVVSALARFGRVDILVNNAAVQIYGPFESLSLEEIQRVLDVSYMGYVRCAQAVLPLMRRQSAGHIINVGSILSLAAAPLISSSTAAQHAVLGWSDALRLELYKSGIDVSAILLPSLSTPMFDHARTHTGREGRPLPPTYDTELAAQAILECARKPRRRMVPVIVQGRLVLWLQRIAPWFHEWLLGRYGVQMQLGPRARQPRGNADKPVPRGVGPYGSVPPTPMWKIAVAAAGVVLLAASAMLGARQLIATVVAAGKRA